jgi:hypothetical protein
MRRETKGMKGLGEEKLVGFENSAYLLQILMLF